MKKGFLCILLAICLLSPLFASCQKEADLTEEAAAVYTLYTITDESTTPEAIREVELALNRIVFFRLNAIVDLVMVTEDEYEQLIEDKFAEIEEYNEKKKNDKKNNKKESDAESSKDGDGETSELIKTGDYWIDILAEGGDIVLEEPRLDIFLVRGYEQYYNYATNNMLAQIDTQLNNEAKALKSAIHSTFLTAAKVNNKTYGVPVNNAIGEYTYLAFDNEYLEQHGIDPNTIKSLEDLQDYLALLKANNPDVIPLASATESADISFLANDGFPILVSDSGVVSTAYDDEELLDYLAMIARYRALGYFENDGTEDAKCAVQIVKGNTDTIAQLEQETGRSYSTSVYSNPVAINENTIDNIFCVSKYVVSNELTAVMKIVAAINTDAQLMNLLTYGVENTHYVLDDNGQVERLNEDYMMNPQYTGNSFITYTLQGENPDKWSNAIQQNQHSVVSPSLGFTVDYTEFEYLDEEGNTQIIFEPNYLDIINGVVDQYYPSLINGTATVFDYETVYKEAQEAVDAEIREELTALYETRLKAQYILEISKDVEAKQGDKLYDQAESEIIKQVKDRLINPLTALLKTELQAEFPDATAEEIEAMIPERLTDEYINDHLYYQYSEERVNSMIDGTYQNLLSSAVNKELNTFMESSTYKNALASVVGSDDYKADLEKMLTYDAPDRISDKLDALIAESLSTYNTEFLDAVNTAIEEAINTFIADYSEILDMTEEEILIAIDYLDAPDASEDEEGAEGEDTGSEEVEEETFENWFDFVFKVKFRDTYYDIFGDPTT